MPEHLSAEARAEWQRLAPVLVRLKLLSSLDRAAFSAYCQAWGRHVEAEGELAKASALAFTQAITNPCCSATNARRGRRQTSVIGASSRRTSNSTWVTACRRSGRGDPGSIRQPLAARGVSTVLSGRDGPRSLQVTLK